MKLLHLAYWWFLCVIVIVEQTLASNGQNINRTKKNLKIRIDFQSAQPVADLLERDRITDAVLNRVGRLFANQQLIKKTASNKTASRWKLSTKHCTKSKIWD